MTTFAVISQNKCPSLDELPDIAYAESLTGVQGTNRDDPSDCAIEASSDFEAVARWLNQHRGNEHTFRNYKKETERLLLWCVLQHKKPLSSLNMDDFDAYFTFLDDPEPRSFWVAEKNYKKGHQGWRPFTGSLSPNSLRNAIRVVNSMMSFLKEAGYLKRNPVALLRRKDKIAPDREIHKRLERILDLSEWQELLSTIEHMSESTDIAHLKKSRARFIFAFMFLTGVRTEEFTKLSWRAIKKRDGYFWLDIKGKRGKEASLPINDELLLHIQKYRQTMGFVPLPLLNEDAPILTSLNGKASLTPKQLYNLIKGVGEATIERLGLVGKEAEKYKQFSGHWIRHLLKSYMAKIRINPDYQQYIMRHADMSVTDLYQHSYKDELILEAQRILLRIK